MDIAEIRTKKRELEERIAFLLRDFQQDSQCPIASVSVDGLDGRMIGGGVVVPDVCIILDI